jgi:UrcA family protein
MTRKLIAVASACAFLGAAFAASPALAGGEQGNMTVVTGDLNLRSDSGAQVVLRRIKNASSAFCEDDNRTRDLGRSLEASKCRDRMMYLAVNKLDAPLVTARYQASGAKPPILMARR